VGTVADLFGPRPKIHRRAKAVARILYHHRARRLG